MPNVIPPSLPKAKGTTTSNQSADLCNAYCYCEEQRLPSFLADQLKLN